MGKFVVHHFLICQPNNSSLRRYRSTSVYWSSHQSMESLRSLPKVDQEYLVADIYMANTKTYRAATQIMVPESCIRVVIRRCCVGETLATLPRRRQISMSDDKVKFVSAYWASAHFRFEGTATAFQACTRSCQTIECVSLPISTGFAGQETNCDKCFALKICHWHRESALGSPSSLPVPSVWEHVISKPKDLPVSSGGD